VHDLGEAIAGDAPDQRHTPGDRRVARERADFAALVAPLDPNARSLSSALRDEHAAGLTPEAKLAQALDKIETIDRHNLGANPPGLEHGFDLSCGRGHAAAVPGLAALRRLVAAATARRTAENGSAPGPD
jgi:5'-deoxynucleotidase YfbR-like HD superfamily hydrolase